MGWKEGKPLGPALGNSSSKGLIFPLRAFQDVGGRLSGHRGGKGRLGLGRKSGTGGKRKSKSKSCAF